MLDLAMSDMPGEMIEQEVRDAFESYDISGNGSVSFI